MADLARQPVGYAPGRVGSGDAFAEERRADRNAGANANADSKLKAVWWLAATLGQHNNYEGTVFEYQPVDFDVTAPPATTK